MIPPQTVAITHWKMEGIIVLKETEIISFANWAMPVPVAFTVPVVFTTPTANSSKTERDGIREMTVLAI